MSRKIALFVCLALWILVAWYWVAWPGLGYLQARDVLGGVTSWDSWKPLVLGPLDSDFLPQNATGYQYVLIYGNWLFGWVLLAAAVGTVSRPLDDETSNLFYKLSYVFLLAVVVVFLIFGGGKSERNFQNGDESNSSSNSTSEQGEESARVTTTTVVNEWSYGFRALQEQMLDSINTGANQLLSHRDESAKYTKWAEWGISTAFYFQSASDDVLQLLVLLDDEKRADSYKDYFNTEMVYLRDVLGNSIRYAGELGDCAKKSRRDGDCDEELGRLFRSVEEAYNSAVLR